MLVSDIQACSGGFRRLVGDTSHRTEPICCECFPAFVAVASSVGRIGEVSTQSNPPAAATAPDSAASESLTGGLSGNGQLLPVAILPEPVSLQLGAEVSTGVLSA